MNISRNEIRVGIIRCDTHAAWFAALMAEHDVWKLRSPTAFNRELKYSWMVGGVHALHYTRYGDPSAMTAPYAGGFRIAKVWDEDLEVAKIFAGLFLDVPEVCETVESVSDDVDLVFVSECNGDGSDHYQLAAPGLRKGVPTFVDKPYALTLKDARRIDGLAKEHGAPVFSCSILQLEPETLRFRSRLPETGGVVSGIVTGFSLDPAALLSSLAGAHTIFGGGIKNVRVFPAPGGDLVHLDYGGQPERPSAGVLVRCGEAKYRWTTFNASAYGPDGAVHGRILHDYYCQHGTAAIIELIREMVLQRKTPAVHADSMEIVAAMDAVLRAQRSGKPEDVEQ